MKTPKMVTLDTDIVVLLKKEANASELINDLLKEHYRKISFEEMSYNEKIKLIAKKEAELEYAKKLEVIEKDAAQSN